jgi:hypothetical protein
MDMAYVLTFYPLKWPGSLSEFMFARSDTQEIVSMRFLLSNPIPHVLKSPFIQAQSHNPCELPP